MDRSEVYPLVYIGLFIAFYSILATATLTAIAYSDYQINQPEFVNYTPLKDITAYEVYDGENSSNDGLKFYNITDSPEAWWVTVPGYNDIQVMANENTDNLIQFVKKQEGAWFNLPSDFVVKQYSKDYLIERINDLNDDVQLNIDVKLEKVFKVSFVAYPNETLYEGFNTFRFTVVVGEYIGNVSEEEKNTLDTFKSLVMFDIPGVPTFLSFLIASPITILGTYLIVRIILMFIPLVPGGG